MDHLSITPATNDVLTNPVENPPTQEGSGSSWWSNLWEYIKAFFGATTSEPVPAGIKSEDTVDPNEYLQEKYDESHVSADDVFGDTANTGSSELDDMISSIGGNIGPSISSYFKDHPEASGEEALRYMASLSDEFAEKYIDYLLEKQSISDANAYNASREDTAYQRQIEDLKKAGLNPALLYGGSASLSGYSSSGTLNMTGSAQKNQVDKYSKIKNLLLKYLVYSYQKDTKEASTITGGVRDLAMLLIPLLML